MEPLGIPGNSEKPKYFLIWIGLWIVALLALLPR
jgi:hypothetical protein